MDVFDLAPSALTGLQDEQGAWADDINVAPTQAVAAVRAAAEDLDQTYRLDRLRWWLTPSWAKEMSTKYAMFNAKAETLATKPAFAKSFRHRRCVVPVSGFYEWSRVALLHSDLAGSHTEPQKLPHLVRPTDTAGLLLAGVWDRWQDPQSAAVVESFAIVTTAATSAMQVLHHRQPVILDAAGAQAWLDGNTKMEELQALLEPQLRVDLQLVPVGRELNNARHKDPQTVRAIGPVIDLVADDVTH